METILLGFLGLVVLIFCIVDLYHLHKMLKTMRDMTEYMYELVNWETTKWQNRN